MWSIHHDPEHWDKPDLFNPGNTHTATLGMSNCLKST